MQNRTNDFRFVKLNAFVVRICASIHGLRAPNHLEN